MHTISKYPVFRSFLVVCTTNLFPLVFTMNHRPKSLNILSITSSTPKINDDFSPCSFASRLFQLLHTWCQKRYFLILSESVFFSFISSIIFILRFCGTFAYSFIFSLVSPFDYKTRSARCFTWISCRKFNSAHFFASSSSSFSSIYEKDSCLF